MSERAGHPDDLDLWRANEPTVLAHVQECQACGARRRQVQAEQRAAQAALAPLSGPLPVPPDVRRRLEVALAGASDVVAARRAAPAVSRSRARPWMAVAAASAAVVVGAAVVLPQLGGGSDSASTATDVLAEAGSAADVPALPGDLLEAANALQPAPALALAPGCGTALAAELGGSVVGVAEPAGPGRVGVLVVVDLGTGTGTGTGSGSGTGTGRSAWWLPACGSPAAVALGTSPLP